MREKLAWKLKIAERYLQDCNRAQAMRVLREAQVLLDSRLSAGEDLGDVSDHLLTEETLS